MTRTHQLEAAITASASRHLAARRCQSGGAAPAAGVWIETPHVRYVATLRGRQRLSGGSL